MKSSSCPLFFSITILFILIAPAISVKVTCPLHVNCDVRVTDKSGGPIPLKPYPNSYSSWYYGMEQQPPPQMPKEEHEQSEESENIPIWRTPTVHASATPSVYSNSNPIRYQDLKKTNTKYNSASHRATTVASVVPEPLFIRSSSNIYVSNAKSKPNSNLMERSDNFGQKLVQILQQPQVQPQETLSRSALSVQQSPRIIHSYKPPVRFLKGFQEVFAESELSSVKVHPDSEIKPITKISTPIDHQMIENLMQMKPMDIVMQPEPQMLMPMEMTMSKFTPPPSPAPMANNLKITESTNMMKMMGNPIVPPPTPMRIRQQMKTRTKLDDESLDELLDFFQPPKNQLEVPQKDSNGKLDFGGVISQALLLASLLNGKPGSDKYNDFSELDDILSTSSSTVAPPLRPPSRNPEYSRKPTRPKVVKGQKQGTSKKNSFDLLDQLLALEAAEANLDEEEKSNAVQDLEFEKLLKGSWEADDTGSSTPQPQRLREAMPMPETIKMLDSLRKSRTPHGLYYWLDMNAFLRNGEIRPKIGDRSYFIQS